MAHAFQTSHVFVQGLAHRGATLSLQLGTSLRAFSVRRLGQPAPERGVIQHGRVAVRIIARTNERAELIRHSRRVGRGQPRHPQPDVVAFHLDVIFDSGEAGDLILAADETLGAAQAENPGIDLLRLFLDVLEQAL